MHCKIKNKKLLHDRIISLRGERLVYKTSLTPPLFNEVPVPSQESGCSTYLCVSGYIFDLFLRFLSVLVSCQNVLFLLLSIAGISVYKSLMFTRGFSFMVHGWLHTECPPIFFYCICLG